MASEQLTDVLKRLRELCPMGSTVYTYAGEHASHLFLCVPTIKNGKPELAAITGMVCTATDRTWCQKCGGMRKTTASDAVYELGHALYPDGGPIEHGRGGYHAVDGREPDGGFLLRQCRL